MKKTIEFKNLLNEMTTDTVELVYTHEGQKNPDDYIDVAGVATYSREELEQNKESAFDSLEDLYDDIQYWDANIDNF